MRTSFLWALLVLQVAPLYSLNGASPARPGDAIAPTGKLREIQFTTNEGSWMSLAPSPDGRWLTFDLLGNIYRLPIAGGRARCLTCASKISLNYHPAVSPDGRLIAFVSDRSGQDGLWVMRSDGTGARPVFVDESSRLAQPIWENDRTILAVRRMATRFGLYVWNDTIWSFDIDGRPPTRLAPLEEPSFDIRDEYSGSPRYQWPSPDPAGRYVYFGVSAFTGDDRHLGRLDRRTGKLESVTSTKTVYRVTGGPPQPTQLGEAAPMVSPNGRYLAFVRRLPEGYLEVGKHRRSGRSALWLRDLATGKDRILMDPITYDGMQQQPQWKARVAPGYAWFQDGGSILISEGGKIRRVWLADGHVETIPFSAEVRREVSEQARPKVAIDDTGFTARFERGAVTNADRSAVLFEAAGSIWRKDLPGAAVRALTPNGLGGLQSGAAWSPNGREVAFVTSDGYRNGAVWKVDSDGNTVRVTPDSGIYLNPFWSPAGKTIYVSRWPVGLEREPLIDEQNWELVALPSEGGQPVVVASAGSIVDGLMADGRFVMLERLPGGREGRSESGPSVPPVGLISFDAKNNRQKIAQIVGAPDAATVSPDGRWLAIEQFDDIYLAPLVPGMEPINVLGSGVRRLTHSGGGSPRWLDNGRLQLISGQSLETYDTEGKALDRISLDLKIPRAGGSGTLALTGARLITLSGAGVIEKGTIVVKDHRIVCVGQCDTAGVAKVIDATGKTIGPGWFDSHAHILSGDPYLIAEKRPALAASLAYGVTTIHDPYTTTNLAFELSELIEAGQVTGPRSFATGWALACYPPGWEHNRPIETPQDAMDEAERRMKLGALMLKDYRLCTRKQRQWLTEAARANGLGITNEGAEPEFLLGSIMSGDTGWEHPIELNPMFSDLTTFFGKAGAHFSTQFLHVDHPFARDIGYYLGERDLWADPKMARWTPWPNLAMRRFFGRKPIEEYSFPIQAESAEAIAKAGGYVPLGNHGEVPGIGMHWEVWSYAAGSSPLSALRAVSKDTAHFLGLEHELGSLEAGKLADLVVYDANPLEDIRNTLRIRFVMKAGTLFDPQTLDEIWPMIRPYGGRPWELNDIRRGDTRKMGSYGQVPN